MSVHTPEWVKHAVFYQIFPDRFARSPYLRHPRGLQFKPWGSPPAEQGFQGGDLLGVVEKLDYLTDLGVNALYLNPVFASASNHRYHTFDYLQVDPLLGGNEALRRLLDDAHGRGVRVVLDGVFNHASRGFWAFHHILESGGDSPYLDWFVVHDWPLRPYHADADNPPNYAAWWGIPALPKFNVANPGVRDYLLAVAEHWIDFGIDGWRLDVPAEIDDVAFWQEFRHIVKTKNSEAYIVGEIWNDAPDWLRGDRFDAVMNYGLQRAAIGFFGHETLRADYRPGGYELAPLNVQEFAAALHHLLTSYSWEITGAQLNLIDSHDTARALWMLGGDKSALRLCALLQMTLPGAPCIYYGDEIGMDGGPDPDSRGAFPWHERERWDDTLHDFYRRVIRFRHQHPALRTGQLDMLYASGDLFAFRRALADEELLVIFNVGRRPAVRPIPMHAIADGRFRAVWGSGEAAVSSGSLANAVVPARNALVLQRLLVG